MLAHLALPWVDPLVLQSEAAPWSASMRHLPITVIETEALVSSTDLAECVPTLQHAWRSVKAEYEAIHEGHALIITCTYRSPEEQAALYTKGRTKPGRIVTQIDGVSMLSNHNYRPSRALDFAVVVNGKISWNPEEYKPVGALAVMHGLTWGGSWPHFKDYPHLEIHEA